MSDIVEEGLKIINRQARAIGTKGVFELELNLEYNFKNHCWEVNCFFYDGEKGLSVETWKFFPDYKSAKTYFENLVKKHKLKFTGEEEP